MPRVSWDAIDRRILRGHPGGGPHLERGARRPGGPLAVAMLAPGCAPWRMRRSIRRYVTLVDAEAIGLPINVFATVTLEKQVERALERFERAVAERPEVMECYLMTGEFDYLLRVVVPSLGAYERFLMDHLTRIEVIASIKSSFALKQVRYKTALPLAHIEG